MADPAAQPQPEEATVTPNLCCGFLAFLFCGDAKVEPMEAPEPSQDSQKEDSEAPAAPEAAPDSPGVLPKLFAAIKEKVVGTSDPAHSEKTHPTRIIPINETTPEPRHEFDDWHLGEARAPEIQITAENAKEHQEKLIKILHGYDCRQKYMARLQLIIQGHLICEPCCSRSHCPDMQKSLIQLIRCRAYCEDNEHFTMLTLIKHWRECTNAECPVCGPCKNRQGEQAPPPASVPEDPNTPPLVEPLFIDFNGNPFLPMPDIHPLPDWRNFVPDRLREHLQGSIRVAVQEKAVMIEENAFLASATRGEYYARLALEVGTTKTTNYNFDFQIYEYNLPETEKIHAAPDSWQSQTPLATRHQEIMKLFIVINQDPFPPESGAHWVNMLLDTAINYEKFWFEKSPTQKVYFKEMRSRAGHHHAQNRVMPLFL
ncbi:hypothetical protein B9Z55_004192 [Caenorhabditis nigoni]|uniref:histone acetyltransferase n=1 Tax=Caenorhabditis nigoni TaxID=1611254 RepID=A0A2G5UV78_9PELO|nr:hypothetical protein B9Z55_004192 [Caenorhabditis nigoni]